MLDAVTRYVLRGTTFCERDVFLGFSGCVLRGTTNSYILWQGQYFGHFLAGTAVDETRVSALLRAGSA